MNRTIAEGSGAQQEEKSRGAANRNAMASGRKARLGTLQARLEEPFWKWVAGEGAEGGEGGYH